LDDIGGEIEFSGTTAVTQQDRAQTGDDESEKCRETASKEKCQW
jgi:hypothetical protein